MKRIFQIEEQTIEDPTTKLRLEFASVHSDEVAAGNDPPGHDQLVLMRMWDTARMRMVTFMFERNGKFIKAEIEPVVAEPVLPAGEAGEGKPVTFTSMRSDGDDSADVQGLAEPLRFE